MDHWVNKPVITMVLKSCNWFPLQAIQGNAYHWIDLPTLGRFHDCEQSHSGLWHTPSTIAWAPVRARGSKMSMCVHVSDKYNKEEGNLRIWRVNTTSDSFCLTTSQILWQAKTLKIIFSVYNLHIVERDWWYLVCWVYQRKCVKWPWNEFVR